MISSATHDALAPDTRLSYKFQRLREQLRQAILGGELRGRLPGERALGRRFGANAKTINKALGDLSAEGLVIRRVGRGTFVAGADQASPPRAARRLWWAGRGGEAAAAADALLAEVRGRDAHAAAQDDYQWLDGDELSAAPRGSRPTLREIDGIILHGVTPSAEVIAEIMRRHIPTVTAECDVPTARFDSVLADEADAGFRLTELMAQLGWRRILLVSDDADAAGPDRAYNGYEPACRRRQIAPMEPVRSDRLEQVVTDPAHTALNAVGSTAARRVAEWVDRLSGAQRPALACIAAAGDPWAADNGVTAYEVQAAAMADWIVRLLRENRQGQPPLQVIVPGRVMLRESTRPMQNGVVREIPSPTTEAVV